MPKIRLLNLAEQWSYEWRAARLGHADKIILRSFVKLQVVVANFLIKRQVASSRFPRSPNSLVTSLMPPSYLVFTELLAFPQFMMWKTLVQELLSGVPAIPL